MRTYKLIWMGGKREFIQGVDIHDALRRMDYRESAVSFLSSWDEQTDEIPLADRDIRIVRNHNGIESTEPVGPLWERLVREQIGTGGVSSITINPLGDSHPFRYNVSIRATDIRLTPQV